MAKRPVTMAMREEDIVKLDLLAGEHRLTRGDAVGLLLEGRLGGLPPDANPDYIPPPPARVALARAVMGNTERYVGARSVSTQGETVVEVVPPDASVPFLKKQVVDTFEGQKVPRQEEVSQDPKDW